MAVETTSDLAGEVATLRARAGLLDRSTRGKLLVSGGEAAEYLQGQVTNDVEALEPGRGCYAAHLTPKGKMLADMRVLRIPAGLLLDTEPVCVEALALELRRYRIGRDARVEDRTAELALLAVAGPEARAVLGRAGAEAVAGLPEAEHASVEATVAGAPCTLVAADRGAPGVDVLCPAGARDAVRAALVEAGAAPVSEAAAECLRIEAGIPRFGADMTAETMPEEAGINDRAVSFTKGCYVGQETVARLHYRGRPNRRLRGLRLTAPAAPGEPVLARGQGREAGRVSSACVSPALGPIALATLRREVEPGDEVAVGEEGRPATVAGLPFRAAAD